MLQSVSEFALPDIWEESRCCPEIPTTAVRLTWAGHQLKGVTAMTGSSWDESLATGNKLIDGQHRELIALVDELKDVQDAAEAEVLRVLDKVMHSVLDHFYSEEDLMTQVGYPPIPTQRMVEQHQEFKSYGRLRVLEFRTGVMLSLLPLQAFLGEFLKVHEFGMDRLLADWIREQKGTSASGA
jgi:hemerythrin